MAVIDQHDGIVPLGEFRDAIEPGTIAIHGKDPVGGNQANPQTGRFLKGRF